MQIVQAQSVDSGIRSLRVGVAGFKDCDFLEWGHVRRSDVGPRLATVGRQMNQAIVGASPDAIDVQRRGRDGIDYAALNSFRGFFRAKLANARGRVKRLPREIRTDLLPPSAPLPPLPQPFC